MNDRWSDIADDGWGVIVDDGWSEWGVRQH